MVTNKLKGKLGEEIAKDFLEEKDYKIIQQNYKGKHGEIDLIVLDNIKNELVFVEVKTRTNFMFGMPRESVNKKKIDHIISTAKLYIYINGYINKNIRFDIIEIYLLKDEIKVNHIKQII